MPLLANMGTLYVLRGGPGAQGAGQGRDDERRFGALRRQVALPTEVDNENVLAECDNGLLTIRMKKVHAEAARQIQVKATTRK